MKLWPGFNIFSPQLADSTWCVWNLSYWSSYRWTCISLLCKVQGKALFRKISCKSNCIMSLGLIHTYLKHILPKNLFVNLPPSFTDNIAKVRKVNKSIFGNSVAKVHDVLLHGIEAEHFHRGQKILLYERISYQKKLSKCQVDLWVDCCFSESCLETFEHCGDELQLRFRQFLLLEIVRLSPWWHAEKTV